MEHGRNTTRGALYSWARCWLREYAICGGIEAVSTIELPEAVRYEIAVWLHSNPANQTAQTAVSAFSSALAARFSQIVGCTRSWDSENDPTDFQVRVSFFSSVPRISLTWNQGYHR